MPDADLLVPLRKHWGYESFRPLQERIIRSVLAGKDTCVVMPTGGGKSLCYQLPAVVLEKTVVVISPLISLMQDQAVQLKQMGIPAAALNSLHAAGAQAKAMREAAAGRYRLVYLSPERMAREETIAWLKTVPVAFFAIDEAHCISEWGHEFRPEYRQLQRLREEFPDRPIAAFTASATRQVRHDILSQLRLRDPGKFIASFHRANLRYFVAECTPESQAEMLLGAARACEEGSVIVYVPTIARVAETVAVLKRAGTEAVGYHGQMEKEERTSAQERWMSDEVRVLVGTVAFGLGINKPGVRAVIHLSLTKSIEQYYQEAGRAGRDGKPADCLLLWQKKDAGLLAYFADQITDTAERERAWQRYHALRRFVDEKRCRHHQICKHFGESPKWESCDACDVCGYEPAWMKNNGASAATLRGLHRHSPRKQFQLPVPARQSPARERIVSSAKVILRPEDQELREYLREWRRTTAKQLKMAAFVVMHDTSLEDLCRKRPTTLEELRQVYGFGERKVASYGPALLAVLAKFSRAPGA